MLIIAVNGPSASGKTTFANQLASRLTSGEGRLAITVLAEDNYYRQNDHLTIEQRAALNFDHPSAFEHERLEKDLGELRNATEVSIPDYCYKTHTRKEQERLLQRPDILIMEGIHLLSNPSLINQFDFSVYIDVPLDICLARRITRDTLERGRTVESVVEQYLTFVRPMYLEFISTNREKADLVLDGTKDIAESISQTLTDSKFAEKFSSLAK